MADTDPGSTHFCRTICHSGKHESRIHKNFSNFDLQTLLEKLNELSVSKRIREYGTGKTPEIDLNVEYVLVRFREPISILYYTNSKSLVSCTTSCLVEQISHKWSLSGQRNEHPKRRVFRRLQKTGWDGVDVTWHGRAFQVRTAVIGKARSATVDSRVRRAGSDDVDADRMRDHAVTDISDTMR